MDEFERLIAEQSRPSPSSSLDARIAGALAPRTHRRQRALTTRHVVAAGSLAACSALVGFFVGRSSAPAQPVKVVHAPAPPEVVREPDTGIEAAAADRHYHVPVDQEQFASLVIAPPPTESLWGGALTTVEVENEEL